MCGNGGRFALFVPIAKLLPPELLYENLFSPLKALRDFRFRGRHDLVVAEPIHVADLDTVNEQAVEPREIVRAFLEGGRLGFLPIPRHWTGQVHGVLLPGSWPWRFKTKS